MKHTIIFLCLLFSLYSFSQKNTCKKKLLVVQYNVENLFDTIDNPHKTDNDFLPQGKKEWNSERYWEKQKKIAEVLHQIDSELLPDIIGLVEIENRNVLEDLIKQKELKKGKYGIVHNESPDRRGIDCALLYKPKSFKLIHQYFYTVKLEGNNYFKTRQILYAKGLTRSKDTLHIFVNHWSSRIGGEEKSEHKRIKAASILKEITDSILNSNANSKIIIMGDFNDETTNNSIAKTLNAKTTLPVNNNELYNTAALLDKQDSGTYYYWRTKKWNMLDQMIVSGELINSSKGLRMLKTEMNIFNKEFILYTDKKGTISPAKTYGKVYYGGYSDHLPIYQYFYFKCKKKIKY